LPAPDPHRTKVGRSPVEFAGGPLTIGATMLERGPFGRGRRIHGR